MMVEAQTTFPVHVIPDSSLGTFSAMSVARGSQPFHIIKYRPVPGQDLDYLICSQCGFILRKFAVPEGQRMDFVSSKQGRDTAMILVKDVVAKKFNLNAAQLEDFRDQILNGTLIHLLSVPISLRVGAWLRKDHPELRDLQKQEVLRDLRQNQETLDPKIRQTFPAKIYNATQAINAAFAMFWAEQLQDMQIAAPWLTDYRREGIELLQALRDIPDVPAQDQHLVDRWADILKLTSWYAWVPYENPAAGATP